MSAPEAASGFPTSNDVRKSEASPSQPTPFLVTIEPDPDFGGFNDVMNLVVRHNGVEIARECEGSEPEDNTFSRDYFWIKPLIERVYALGVADGAKS